MNHYAQAIDNLMGDFDWQAVAADYAKRYPAAFNRAVTSQGLPDWRIEAKSLVDSDRKIDAIKLCREMTGMGLKEAKEAVEALT